MALEALSKPIKAQSGFMSKTQVGVNVIKCHVYLAIGTKSSTKAIELLFLSISCYISIYRIIDSILII